MKNFFFAFVLASLAAGCGGGGGPVIVPVKGKVVCDGKPITGGTIAFHPIASDGGSEPGKLASGVINSDGTFYLTTHSDGDGGTVGENVVFISPPIPGDIEDDEEDDVFEEGWEGIECDPPEDLEMDIPEGGSDNFVIDLAKD